MGPSENKTRRVALLGVFTALAFILGFIESLIPSFTGIPGVKAGFANIVTMVALYLLNDRYNTLNFVKKRTARSMSHSPEKYVPSVYSLLSALCISAVRIILAGLSYSGMSAAIYGLSGAVFSLTVMFFLARARVFSVTAVSVAGGVAHNLAQLLLACLMLGNAVIYYLPALIVSGLAAGLIIGIIAALLINRLSLLAE